MEGVAYLLARRCLLTTPDFSASFTRPGILKDVPPDIKAFKQVLCPQDGQDEDGGQPARAQESRQQPAPMAYTMTHTLTRDTTKTIYVFLVFVAEMGK